MNHLIVDNEDISDLSKCHEEFCVFLYAQRAAAEALHCKERGTGGGGEEEERKQ